MNRILSVLFFLALGLTLHAQCTLTTMIDQVGGVNCQSTELTFMGFATGSCPSLSYAYTWQAFEADASGAPIAIDSLTETGTAVSGTSFANYTIPLFPGANYVQV